MIETGVALGSAYIVGETYGAILVRMIDGSEDFWVPKHEVHYDSELWRENKSNGFLVVKLKFAKRMHLIDSDKFR